MDKFAIIVSAITAFIIGAGGSLGVALVATKGAAVDATVWILAIVLGLVTAAKDVRSLLKFPPVDGGGAPPTNPPSASRLPLLLFGGLMALGLVGCAGSYDRQVFRIEGAALGTADGAMRGYAVYYKSATNNPAAFKRSLADLNAERDRMCALSVKVGASGELVEQLRQSYKTNSAVQPALAAGVATLVANMNGILTYATNVIHINPE